MSTHVVTRSWGTPLMTFYLARTTDARNPYEWDQDRKVAARFCEADARIVAAEFGAVVVPVRA